MMPISESTNLLPGVPLGIQQDVQEAERCHFAQCYKASVVMCRRALQLGLIEKGISDTRLKTMIQNASDKGILTGRNVALAESIKDFGDGGAHRPENITAQDANLTIYACVGLLNEMFKPAKP